MDDREMDRLIRKYRRGRIPSLIDVDRPDNGLIQEDFFKIYQSGFLGLHSLTLGILLEAKGRRSSKGKWQKGDFRLNDHACRSWGKFCATLRGSEVGNRTCERCDRRYAVLAEEAGQAIAYLCDNGMLDFAVPIWVMERVIAILYSGQQKPKEGQIWNPEMLRPNGMFRPLAPGEAGVDIWEESQRRIRQLEKQADFEKGELLRLLDEDATEPVAVASPGQVEEMLQLMRNTGRQLSHLAASTFELEKSKVISWIRGHIARALESLSQEPMTTRLAWESLSTSLNYVVQYFGTDYVLILSCNEANGGIRLLCQSGLPDAERWLRDELAADKAAATRVISSICSGEGPAELALRERAGLPFFKQLNRKHSKRSKVAQVIPLVAPEASPLAMIAGRFDQNLDFASCLTIDREAWDAVVQDIALVTGIVLLVEQVEERSRRQALFMEDVAHDIRDPIQNIIVLADVLNKRLVSTEQTAELARKLAAHARRLHTMSERLWTVENLDRGAFVLDRVEPAYVYNTVMECRKSLIDLARRQNIEIRVDPTLQGWPPIQVNKSLFNQVVLNLVDNAIKYSRRGTEIRVDGKRQLDGVCLSFVNRGIPIQEEDRECIFMRYFRTKEAQQHIQSGTGIGLYIVKVFADTYGKVEVKSEPMHEGAKDSVTEFRLFIKDRRWQSG